MKNFAYICSRKSSRADVFGRTHQPSSTKYSQVGNCGFNPARAAHDMVLIAEFERRGIDISCISKGRATSFANKVTLDQTGRRLVIVE